MNKEQLLCAHGFPYSHEVFDMRAERHPVAQCRNRYSVPALLADNERLTAQNKRLQDERDARLWHHPMWSSTPGGSITDGQCVMCRQMWPCAFVRNTGDQAYAERDIAAARADAAEARLTQLTEALTQATVPGVDSGHFGQAVVTDEYELLRFVAELRTIAFAAAASVVSETGETK